MEAGFEAQIHVLAVHKFVSRTRIFGRYYDQLRTNGQGRYTLPTAHDASYDKLSAAVEAILASGMFTVARAYGDTGAVIVEASGLEARRLIRDAIVQTHATLPRLELCEELLGLLDMFEAEFARRGRTTVIADIQALRMEIGSARRASGRE